MPVGLSGKRRVASGADLLAAMQVDALAGLASPVWIPRLGDAQVQLADLDHAAEMADRGESVEDLLQAVVHGRAEHLVGEPPNPVVPRHAPAACPKS